MKQNLILEAYKINLQPNIILKIAGNQEKKEIGRRRKPKYSANKSEFQFDQRLREKEMTRK
jgi:hypothetical protein